MATLPTRRALVPIRAAHWRMACNRAVVLPGQVTPLARARRRLMGWSSQRMARRLG